MRAGRGCLSAHSARPTQLPTPAERAGPGTPPRCVHHAAASSVLNRVVGQDPSAILGTLSSNGRVFLINPNGILFGQGSRVDVGGPGASTLNITDPDFLAGRLSFQAGAVANSIVNQGEIVS